METSSEEKSLATWRLELKRFGKKHWLRYYAEMLGASVSNIPRFYKALKLYGDSIMFDAIVSATMSDVAGDPLAYTIKIASNKWKEEQLALDADTEYEEKIKRSIEESQRRNDELAKKLGR